MDKVTRTASVYGDMNPAAKRESSTTTERRNNRELPNLGHKNNFPFHLLLRHMSSFISNTFDFPRLEETLREDDEISHHACCTAVKIDTRLFLFRDEELVCEGNK